MAKITVTRESGFYSCRATIYVAGRRIGDTCGHNVDEAVGIIVREYAGVLGLEIVPVGNSETKLMELQDICS